MADVHAYLLSTSATGSTGASTAEAAAAEAAAAKEAAAEAAAAEAAAAEAAASLSSTADSGAAVADSYYPGQAETDASFSTLILAALAERSPRTLDELLAYTKAGRVECAPCASLQSPALHTCMLMRCI